jgi:hypothetical protein
MAVFWDVAPCSLVDIDRRFRGAYIWRQPRTEDGGSIFLQNFGTYLQVHTELQPRRPTSTE